MNEKISLFTFITDITFNKKNILSEENEKIYNLHIVNLGLSYYRDCVLFANEMNINTDCIDNKMHYEFLLNSIPQKKRFAKWYKKEKIDIEKNIILSIATKYNISFDKAKDYVRLLPQHEIEKIYKIYGNENEQ